MIDLYQLLKAFGFKQINITPSSERLRFKAVSVGCARHIYDFLVRFVDSGKYRGDKVYSLCISQNLVYVDFEF